MGERQGHNLRFTRERAAGWERLSALLDRAQRTGFAALTGAELLEMGRLYRQAASDLAYARAHFADPALVDRLNSLVGRGHGYVYTSERRGAAGLLAFYRYEFPDLLYRHRAFVLAATAVFLLGGLFGAARPDLSHFIVPDAYNTPHIRSGDSPAVSGMITQNNIRVAFVAFAGGVSFGILTLLILFSNGMMLGGVGGLIARKGQSAGFWPSIAPHGVLELTAIMVAGGAGLLIGWSFLHPGDLPRSRAIARAGLDAIRLVAGTIPMFLVAGAIEGFVSFTVVPAIVKLAVSALSTVALVYYFRRKTA